MLKLKFVWSFDEFTKQKTALKGLEFLKIALKSDLLH